MNKRSVVTIFSKTNSICLFILKLRLLLKTINKMHQNINKEVGKFNYKQY